MELRQQTDPFLRLHDDGSVVLLGHQDTGSERRLDHVDDQVVGQDVQLLHLIPGHICAACDPVPACKHRKPLQKGPPH